MPSDPRSRLRWKRIFYCAAVLGASYAMISLDLSASTKTAETSELHEFREEDNFVAERQKQVTSSSLFGYLLLGGAGAACFLTPGAGRFRWHAPLALSLLGYVGLCYASLLWSADPALSIRKLGILTFFLMAAAGFTRVLDLREFGIAVGGVCFTFTGLGLLVELTHGLFVPWKGWYRFTGSTDPNGQSILCGIICLAALFLLLPRNSRRSQAKLLFAFGLVLLLLTKSRTGLFGFSVASTAGLLVGSKPSGKLFMASVALTVVGAVLLGVACMVSGGADGLLYAASMGRTENIDQLNGRGPLWALLMGEVAQSPLVGVGYSAFWNSRNIDDISHELYWHVPQGHSVYIDILLQLGVVGLALFALMCVLGVLRAAERSNALDDEQYVFAVSVLLFGLCNGVAESKFLAGSLPSLLFFACLVGLAFEPARVTAPEAKRGFEVRPRGKSIAAFNWQATAARQRVAEANS